MTDVTVNLLGTVHLAAHGRVVALARRQPLLLLAVLALAPAPTTRDTLAFLFWADVPHDVARQRLRRVLGQLRDLLDQADAADVVRVRGERIDLAADRCAVDVWRFQRLVADARTANEVTATALFEEALALYSGPFLAGLTADDAPELEQWLSAERERLERLHQQTLAALLDCYVAVGTVGRATALAERLLDLDPLREETHRTLMRLYAVGGQRATALRQYERCTAALAGELGVEPLEETQALRAALLRGEPVTLRATTRAQPAWYTRPSLVAPCVGRQRELATLLGLLADGLRGQPTVACLSGVAGIGKTRLLQEAAQALARPVWFSNGQSAGQNVPYGAVLAALRLALAGGDTLPDLADLWLAEVSRVLPEVRLLRPDLRPPPNLPPDQAQARLFEALTRFTIALARRAGGALLLLDNLEEADAVSLAWLASLARHLAQVPLGLAVAYRPPGEQAALHGWLDYLARLDARRDLPLASWGQETIAELLHQLRFPDTDLAARLWQETGGNPFFVLETLRALQDRQLAPTGGHSGPLPLPETVQEVIRARVRGLDPIARQVLDTAAVAGRSFDFELLRAVGGRDELTTAQVLDALIANQFVVADDAGYRFAHPQIADVLYGDIGEVRRRLLHRRIAETLRLRSPVSAATLAHHLEHAGQVASAVAAWLDAAGQAAQVFATEEALAALSRGLALVGDPASRFALLALREDVLDRLGRRPEQEADLSALADLLPQLGPEPRADLLRRRGRYLLALNRGGEAEQMLRQALVLDSPSQTEATLLLAEALSQQRRWEEAQGIVEPVLGAAAGDSRVQRQALHTLASIARAREDRPALEDYLRRALAVPAPDDALRVRLLLDLGDVLFRQGRHETALDQVGEALRLAQAQANRQAEALAYNLVGNCQTRLSRYAEAMEAFDRARAANEAIQNRQGQAGAVGNMGVLAMRMGLLEQAVAHNRAAYQLFEEIDSVQGMCLAANNIGTTLLWSDRSAEAEPWLRQALERALAARLPIREAASLCNLGAALLERGRPEEGLAMMARGVALRRQLQYGDLCIDVACLAIGHLRAGAPAEADALSKQAVAELATAASGVGHPQRVHFGRAQVLRALGREEEAQGCLDEARARLDEALSMLATAEERERCRTAFNFNRDLLAATRGDWPDPPRLL